VNNYRIAIVAAAVVSAGLLLAAVPGQAQLPKDPEERAKIIAQIMQTQARQITLFDRDGKELGTVALRDLYNQPVLSPDARRVAVIKGDLSFDKENKSRSAKRESRRRRRHGRPTEARSRMLRCAMDPSVYIEKLRTVRTRKNCCTRAQPQ
jgi:hypothetical protein